MRLFLAMVLLSASVFAQDMRAERVKIFFLDQARTVVTPELESVLANGEIIVFKGELRDNGGSLVDAIGEVGKVTLAEDRWMSFLREGRDVRLLVLHELLRMAGVDDDNYRVSRTMMPQAPSTLEARPYCDLRVTSTRIEEKTKEMSGEGFGRSSGTGLLNTVGGSNLRAAQENAVIDLAEKCRAKGFADGVVAQSAYSTMESRNTNGFIRQEMKVVVDGICVKKVSVRRTRKQQKTEACYKASLCRDLLNDGALAPLQEVDARELETIESTWRCL